MNPLLLKMMNKKLKKNQLDFLVCTKADPEAKLFILISKASLYEFLKEGSSSLNTIGSFHIKWTKVIQEPTWSTLDFDKFCWWCIPISKS